MAIGKVKFFNSQGWGFIVPGMVEQTCCGPGGRPGAALVT
jgi:hypothetical protein